MPTIRLLKLLETERLSILNNQINSKQTKNAMTKSHSVLFFLILNYITKFNNRYKTGIVTTEKSVEPDVYRTAFSLSIPNLSESIGAIGADGIEKVIYVAIIISFDIGTKSLTSKITPIINTGESISLTKLT